MDRPSRRQPPTLLAMKANLLIASSSLAVLALLTSQTTAVQDETVSQQTVAQANQPDQAIQADEPERCPFGRPCRFRRWGRPFGPRVVGLGLGLGGGAVIDETEVSVRSPGVGVIGQGGVAEPRAGGDGSGAGGCPGSAGTCPGTGAGTGACPQAGSGTCPGMGGGAPRDDMGGSGPGASCPAPTPQILPIPIPTTVTTTCTETVTSYGVAQRVETAYLPTTLTRTIYEEVPVRTTVTRPVYRTVTSTVTVTSIWMPPAQPEARSPPIAQPPCGAVNGDCMQRRKDDDGAGGCPRKGGNVPCTCGSAGSDERSGSGSGSDNDNDNDMPAYGSVAY